MTWCSIVRPGSAFWKYNMTAIEIHPDINFQELARFFGGENTATFSRRISSKIKQLVKIFKQRLRPQLYYRKMRVLAVKDSSVHLATGLVLKSRKLAKVINGCESVICFIATIGPDVEVEIKNLMDENRLSEAYILDSMGSVAVEDIVEKFHAMMEKQQKNKEQGVTLRFSPGYCDWPIADQKKLFRIFVSRQLGVQLNDSCLMQPRKSISGVFGLMPSSPASSSWSYNPCDDCKKTRCIARRH